MATGSWIDTTTPPATSSVTASACTAPDVSKGTTSGVGAEDAERHQPAVDVAPELVGPVVGQRRQVGGHDVVGSVGAHHHPHPDRAVGRRQVDHVRLGIGQRLLDGQVDAVDAVDLVVEIPYPHGQHADQHRSDSQRGPTRSQRPGRPPARPAGPALDGRQAASDPGPIQRQRRGGVGQSAGDAVPHPFRGSDAGVGQHGRNLPVLDHLGRAARAGLEVALDDRRLVGLDRVEGVRAQQLLDLGVGKRFDAHDDAPPTPDALSGPRIRLSPARIRLFTVPSGSPNMSATSLYVCPPR